jgi:hypothetical protein
VCPTTTYDKTEMWAEIQYSYIAGCLLQVNMTCVLSSHLFYFIILYLFQSSVLYIFTSTDIIEHKYSVPVEMPGPRLLQHEGICCVCAWAPRPVTAAHAILRHREKYNMFTSAKSRIVAVSYLIVAVSWSYRNSKRALRGTSQKHAYNVTCNNAFTCVCKPEPEPETRV